MKTLLFICHLLFTYCFITSAQPSFLDSAFGNNGIVITSLGTSESGSFLSVATQPDHKIIAAGNIVVRYNENGTPDSTFGINGIFIGVSIYSGAFAMALQSDEKIVTAGGGGIMRLNVNGTLDNTFGNHGIDSTIIFWPGMNDHAIAIQPDGKIVIAGTANSNFAAVGRLSPDGIPDSSFGINGLVVTSYPTGDAASVAIMPDGRILTGGSSTYAHSFMTIRYLPDGTLDTSFNHTGIVLTNAGDDNNASGGAIQLQADNKVVVAGNARYTGEGVNYVLVRYNANGSLDRSFGDTGVVNIDFMGYDDEAAALCAVNDEGLIITGVTNSRFGLARIDSTGKTDSAFGSNGRIATTIQDGVDVPRGLALQYDGKIVVAGWSYNSVRHGYDPTLARYVTAPPASVQHPIIFPAYPVLYPNPSGGVLNIDKQFAPHIVMVRATDITGKKIKVAYDKHDNEIKLFNAPDGIYLFNISFNDRPEMVQKIMIQNSK